MARRRSSRTDFVNLGIGIAIILSAVIGYQFGVFHFAGRLLVDHAFRTMRADKREQIEDREETQPE
jgi:hypothetical protein